MAASAAGGGLRGGGGAGAAAARVRFLASCVRGANAVAQENFVLPADEGRDARAKDGANVVSAAKRTGSEVVRDGFTVS